MAALIAAELVEVLRRVAAAPDGVTVNRPLAPLGSAVLEAWGWRLRLVLGMDGRVQQVEEARSPDGRLWWLGCERDWENLSAPVEPWQLLAPHEREALMAVFWSLPCRVVMDLDWGPDLDAVARRQANVAKAKRKGGKRQPAMVTAGY